MTMRDLLDSGETDGPESGGSWCERFEHAPAAITHPMLGLLGGLCGETLSVMLDYPSDVLGPIQSFLLAHLPEGGHCVLLDRSDLRRLARDPTRFALVIVDPVRGHRSGELAVQWLLSRRRGARSPCALFGPGAGIDEAPGAMLTLRAHPEDNRRIRRWLVANPRPDPRLCSFLEEMLDPRTEAESAPLLPPLKVDFAQLRPLIDPTGRPRLWAPKTLRSIDTLRALLAGRASIRSLPHHADGPRRIVPTAEDYACVYKLLQVAKSGLPEEFGDLLLEAMVKRANLYLKHRDTDLAGSGSVSPCRDGLSSRATPRPDPRDGPRRPPITLRELSDLGNIRSSIVRSLLESLVNSNDPGASRELGLLPPIPEGTDPKPLDVTSLGRRLIGWTHKQVRSRFDVLRRQGLVDAERVPPHTGPWLYLLPEEFRPLPGEFQSLPTPEEVVRSLPRRE